MTTIYFIRHGETVANAANTFQGQQNSPLNDSGVAQAKCIANALKDVKFDAIYSSDLDRATATAMEINNVQVNFKDIITDIRFREANFGEWEGHTYVEVMERWTDLAKKWLLDSYSTRPPGGETLDEVVGRVGAAIEDIGIKHKDETVAVICHGGTVRAAVCNILGVLPTIFMRLSVDNCSVTIAVVDGDKRKLKKFNITAEDF